MLAMTRNAQVLKYFAQQYDNVPRKRLVKLVYMADVVAREYLGHPITTFEYRLDQFGPYAPAISVAVEELQAAGLAREWEQEDGPVRWKRLADTRQPVPFDFSLGELEVLEYVCRYYVPMDMQELLQEVVYQTEPYQRAERFHEPLNMDVLNGRGRAEVGFDLEAIVRAEKDAEAGNFLTLEAFADGLRDRLAAGHG